MFFNNRGQRSKNQAKRRVSVSSPLKPRRLMTEALEERQLLAVGVLGTASSAVSETANIISLSDVVSIDSLKQAIANAAATPEDDVIQISPATLQFASSSDEITIDVDSSTSGAIAIEAVGGDVTIDANSLARAFSIKNGDVTLQGITIVNGNADYGGAIANAGDLTLIGVTLSNNTASHSGGAIANSGALYVQDSVITDSYNSGDGVAIYDGDFSWPSTDGPEWSVIPDQVGSKGTTLNVDLTQYVNSGNWTYSVAVADSTSSILASAPKLSGSGVLSFSFIGDDAYYGEDDYSPIAVTVTATDGSSSASTTFQVSLAEQTSVTLAAILSNMTLGDAKSEYLHGTARRPTGYACDDGLPSPTVVDVSDSLTVQVWLQDFDWIDYADKTWDAGDYSIMGVEYRLHLENATITGFTDNTDLTRSAFTHKNIGGDYLFAVSYTQGANFGYEEALLLDVITIEAIDPSKPVSATVYQNSTDWKSPCLTRMYSEPIERDPSRSHINVDPSQTLFISTISNSSEPLSSLPGQPFDTNISRAELDSETLAVSSASVATAKSMIVSNSVIVGSIGSGNGAIYIAEDGTAALYNVTIADNTSSGAAVYYAGTNSNAVAVANSIIVGNASSPLFGINSAPGSLVDASGISNAKVYSGGALFTDAENGDYSLVSGSEALNIGDASKALDIHGDALTVDLAGNDRFSGTIDAGAYEFQGGVPAAPTNVTISDYVESNKAPVLSWTASTSSDVFAYYVYAIDGGDSTVIATVDTTSFDALSSVVSLVDNQLYNFGVAAINEYGVSPIASVTLNTVVAPEAPTNVAFDEYMGGTSATLTWTASENATAYRVQILDASNKWVNVGTVTGTSYVATVEENASYSYRVSAFTTVDSVTKFSKTVRADLSTVVTIAAPTNVAFAEYSGGTSATLTWDASEDASGYLVETLNASNVWETVGTVAETSYTATVEENATYSYRVSAFKTVGSETKYSAAVAADLNTVVAPAAPKNVAFDEYTGGTSATLKWTASPNATGYMIEALNASNKWETVGTVTGTSYVATVGENATYSYRVSAFTTVDEVSKFSKTVRANLNTIVAPAAPSNVAFAEYTDGTSATLTWNASENASGYIVETLNASDVWETVGTVTETSYVATVEENATYSYRVSAFTTVGSETKYSAAVATDLNTVVAPAAPTNVAFAEYTGGTTATLKWTASPNATGYRVQILNDSNVWENVGFVKETSYVATVEENATYSYRVSAYTTVDSVTKLSKTVRADLNTLVPPSGALNLVVSNYDSDAGTARLAWTALDYADHYVVYGQTNGGAWTTLAESVASSPYTLTGIVANTSYAFRVAAVNAAGVGATEDVSFEATLAPSTPADAAFGALDAGNNSIAITWSPVPNATGYIVEAFNSETGEWDVVVRPDDSETFYVVTDLEEGVAYSFAISAYNDAGVSEPTYVSYTISPIPDAPANLTVVFNKPAKSANLSWTLSEGAEGYNVYQQSGTGATWKKIATMTSISNEYTVQNLETNAIYYFAVSAWNESGESDYSIVELLTDVSLEAPTDFVVDSYNAETHRATMSWVDNATDEAGYEVQYSLDNETWISAATLPANANTRVAKGLTPGKTYYFRVAAFDDYGYSDWATTTFDVPAEIPAAPSNVVFSDYDADAKTLLVSWDDNSDDEVGFRVQYSTDQTNWRTVATTNADVASYTAVGLVPGRTYYYRVAAVGLYGDSDYSEVASYTVESTSVEVPAAPSNIVFSDVEFTSNGVNATMSWTDNSNNEDKFVIQFSYDNENWLGAGSTEANVTTRTATGLVAGKTYYFRVAAYNAAGYSDWATTTYVVPTADIAKPGDIVFGDYSNGNLEMSWADNSDNEDGFLVQYSYDGEKWNRAGVTEANVNHRTATRVSPGRTYYFRVAAFQGSSYSDWAYGEYTAPSGVPTEPGEIVFTNYSAENRTVEMSWVDNSNDETGFRIEYSLDGGATWRTSAQTSADVNYRTATGLRVGETYQFRVRSFNAFGSSGWTYGSYAVPTADGAPAAPTNFTFGDYDPVTRTLAMSWTDVADNETGYKVQYSVNNGGSWCFAGNYDANVTSRLATSVVPGRTYVFRVAAYNDSGNSTWLVSSPYDVSDSNYVPAAPTNLVFGEYNAAKQTLPMSWTDNSSDEKGFMVEYSVDGGKTWKVSEYLGADVASRTATKIVAGREYSFRVSAYNNYGVSDYAINSFSAVTVDGVAAPTNLLFSYSSARRRVSATWEGDAMSYNAQYKPSDSSEWYALTTIGKTASINNAIFGTVYDFRVQSVAEDGSLSEWTVGSFDTTASESGATDESDALLAEAFADFFEDDFIDLDV